MDIWKKIIYRWEREELQQWSSLRKTAYMLLPLLIYFAVHDISEVLLWAFLDGLMQHGSSAMQELLTTNTDTVRGVINGGAILIGTAVIWPAIRNEIKGVHKHADVPPKERTQAELFARYGFLLALAFCVAVGVNILFSRLGFTGSSQSFEEVHEMQYGVQFAVGLVLYGIVSPFAEEAVFRGLLYNRMKRCFSVGIALVLSALLFGCYHGNVVQTVYGTILGILIAYLYEIMGGFEVPVLFHSMANVSVYVMTYNNSMMQMEAAGAWMIAVILLIVAGALFLYIKKKLL